MASTVMEGSRALLIETTSALRKADVNNFVVVGGWCPALRNRSELPHPGTLDVDILFGGDSDENEVGEAIEALLAAGMMPSAKHDFQLLKPMNVGADRLVYNVDILHPQMTEDDLSLFVDHLDFDVPIDEDERRVKKMASIVLPNSSVIFEEHLFDNITFESTEVPVVDWTGMALTKIDSCQKQKRDRDSFDILLAVENGGLNLDVLAGLRDENSRIRKSVDKFLTYLEKDSTEFDTRVKKFAPTYTAAAKRVKMAFEEQL